MATTNGSAISTSKLRGALIAMMLAAGADSAWAQEGAQNANLTRPISWFDVGAINVSNSSFKAGEFNGLQKKGGLGTGNFDVKGGAAYDSDSAWRWRLKGTDLGFEGRSFMAEAGVQGKSRFTANYDELLRNRSDSYQTIFDGAGTTNLTLPGAYMIPTIAGSTATSDATNNTSARGLIRSLATRPYINVNATAPTLGGVLNPTATQMGLVNAASSAVMGLFRNFDLATKRTRVDLAFDYNFTPLWGFNASYRPEHREGNKPMGGISRATGGDFAVILPDVIDTNHHLVDTNLRLQGKKAFAQLGYSGSFFRNNVSSGSFQNWGMGASNPATNLVYSTTPNTDYSQVHLTGAYKKSPVTSFTANASYARNTQNDPLLVGDITVPVVPVSSTDGLVVNTALNARFTTRLARKVSVAAAYKYTNRDNQSPVNLFQFMDSGQPLAAPNPAFPAGPQNPLGPVLATNAGATRSYGLRRNQANADVDFKIARWQSLKGAYEYQKVDRACPGSWADCANVDTTHENTYRADWRAGIREDLVGRVGYAFSTRRGTPYNENSFLALVPYANVSPTTATGGMTYAQYLRANGLNGWGPAAGFAVTTGNANVFFPANSETHPGTYVWQNRIAELPGLRRYEVADRDRDKVRASLDWQATEQLSLRIGGDLDSSDYPDARYGLTEASNNGVSADATYTLVDFDFNLSVFYTHEDLRSASAGNTFTVNSNGTAVNGVSGLSGNSGCNNFTTLQERNNNAKLDPCLDWTTARRDDVHTAGLGLSKGAGPLDVRADLVFSRARSDNNVTGGNYVNNILTGPGAPPTTIAAFYIPATPLPTVKTDTTDLRTQGRYALSPRMSLLVAYAYQWMRSDDYALEGLQIGEGTIANVFPTNEKPFNYGVHSFSVSYVFGW